MRGWAQSFHVLFRCTALQTHQCTYPPGSSQNLVRTRFSHGISLHRYDWLNAISSSSPLSEVQGVGLKVLTLLLFHLWLVPGEGIHRGSLRIIKDTPTTQEIPRILGALCQKLEKRPNALYTTLIPYPWNISQAHSRFVVPSEHSNKAGLTWDFSNMRLRPWKTEVSQVGK